MDSNKSMTPLEKWRVVGRGLWIAAILGFLGIFISLIVGDIQRYFVKFWGYGEQQALIAALAIEIAIPVLIAFPYLKFRDAPIVRPFLVLCALGLAAFQVWIASDSAMIPLVEIADDRSWKDGIADDYRGQIEAIDAQIRASDALIAKMPDDYLTKHSKELGNRKRLVADRQAVVEKLQAVEGKRKPLSKPLEGMIEAGKKKAIVARVFWEGLIVVFGFLFGIAIEPFNMSIRDDADADANDDKAGEAAPVIHEARKSIGYDSGSDSGAGSGSGLSEKAKEMMQWLKDKHDGETTWQKVAQARQFGRTSDFEPVIESLVDSGRIEVVEKKKKYDRVIKVKANGNGRHIPPGFGYTDAPANAPNQYPGGFVL